MAVGRELLAAWIRRSRLQKGQVARLLDISPQFLSHILTGYRLPRLPYAVKIKELTGIPVESWMPTRLGRSGKRVKAVGKSSTLA